MIKIEDHFKPFTPTGQHDVSWATPLKTINFDGREKNRISASLYLSPRCMADDLIGSWDTKVPGIKNSGVWEMEYFLPLVRHICQREPKWTFRVYVAQNTPERYINWLKGLDCEIFIMDYEPEWRHERAGLWRYLALRDSDVTITCGADQKALDPVVLKTLRLWMDSGDRLLRWMKPGEAVKNNAIHYHPILGGLACRKHKGIVTAASAWSAQAALNEQSPTVIGMSHRRSIHQDELFLSHWLYYEQADSMMTCLAKGYTKSDMLEADLAHLKSKNPDSTVIYY